MTYPVATRHLWGSFWGNWSPQWLTAALLVLALQCASVTSEAREVSVEEAELIAAIREAIDIDWADSPDDDESLIQQVFSESFLSEAPSGFLLPDRKEAEFGSPKPEEEEEGPVAASSSSQSNPLWLRANSGDVRGPYMKFRDDARVLLKGPHSTLTALSWNDTKRYGFSGRPSCPARSPSVDERRRRAGTASGSALLESQLLQQQRWLFLQQKRNDKLQQHQQVQYIASGLPSAAVSGDSVNPGEEHGGSRPEAVAAPDGPSRTHLGFGATLPQGGKFTGSLPNGYSSTETQNSKARSCPRAPLVSPLSGLLPASTCPRRMKSDISLGLLRKDAFDAEHGKDRNDNRSSNGEHGMRPVVGGLEAAMEEIEASPLLGAPVPPNSNGEPSAALKLRSILPLSASALTGARGAAVGEGESPFMTWVLGTAPEDVEDSSASIFAEGESLLEALDYSFSLHAEEVQKEILAFGMALGHAAAGTPQVATLQFSFDSVPLHEQRVIRRDLTEGRRGMLSNLKSTVLTPAQVQLRDSRSGELLSLTEEERMHSGSLFDEWIRGLEGFDGAAALQVFSLSLEDLRVILALQEETGGPVSLVTAEDWGEGGDLSRFLTPVEEGNTSSSWDDFDTEPEDTEEDGEDYSNSDEAVDNSYWHWLIADPAAW